MGTDQVLSSVLARLRTALRLDGMQVLVGHGVADAAYRPPHLPYASVVGPLAIETEPERTTPPRMVRVRNPGYLAGRTRGPADLVPPPGTLGLEIDGAATAVVQVRLGGLAGSPFTATAGGASVGALVAASLQEDLRAAVTAGEFRADGQPITDADRLGELGAVTVRWDRVLNRLVIASGRRGPLTGPPMAGTPSSVALVAGGAEDVATALGLTDAVAAATDLGPPGSTALAAPGTTTRARDVAPTAVAVDLRVDLWAGTQATLATMVDAWVAATPLRAEVLLDPTALAEDVGAGDRSVRLAPGLVPRMESTVLAAGIATDFGDRVSGRAPVLAGAVNGPNGLALAGTDTATYLISPVRPVPVAWQPRPPGMRGWSAEVLLRVVAGAPDGSTMRVFDLVEGSRSVLRLDVTRDAGRYVLRGSAVDADGAPFGASRVAIAGPDLEGSFVLVHVLVDAATGSVRVAADGATPVDADPPAPGPTASTGEADLVLRVGDPAGASLDVVLGEVGVYARPVGPADPRLRVPGPASVRWSPGTPLYLGRSDNGYATRGPQFFGYVLAVEGDVLRLDRSVPEGFSRSDTIAHQGALFVSQRQLRRNDDLMNRIYRVAVEYRVSAFLDDVAAAVSAPVVEVPDVEVRELARLLAESGGPPVPPARGGVPAGVGVRTVITSGVLAAPHPSGTEDPGPG